MRRDTKSLPSKKGLKGNCNIAKNVAGNNFSAELLHSRLQNLTGCRESSRTGEGRAAPKEKRELGLSRFPREVESLSFDTPNMSKARDSNKRTGLAQRGK